MQNAKKKVTCAGCKKRRCAGGPEVSAEWIDIEGHSKFPSLDRRTINDFWNCFDRNLPRSCCDASNGTSSWRATPQVSQETQVSIYSALVSQGSKTVPSGCPGLVDFPTGQVTFHSHLPDGQWSRCGMRRGIRVAVDKEFFSTIREFHRSLLFKQARSAQLLHHLPVKQAKTPRISWKLSRFYKSENLNSIPLPSTLILFEMNYQ